MSVVATTRVAPSRVLLVASFGAFLAFLDATIVNVAFPSIRESFPDTTIGGLSWVLNAYNIVFAAFLIVCGRLTDLVGRRRSFVTGVAVFTVASVLCGAAPSVELLVAARVVQALGAAMLVPGLAGPRHRGLPVGAAVARDRPLGRLGRRRGRTRPAHRWRARRARRLALGLPRQPALRHRRPRRRPGASSSRAGRRGGGRMPDLVGAALMVALPGRAEPRHHQGRRLGVDEPRGDRLLRGDRPWPWSLFVRQLAAAPHAAARPAAAAAAVVRHRVAGHRRRGLRLLRLPADQHPVAARTSGGTTS